MQSAEIAELTFWSSQRLPRSTQIGWWYSPNHLCDWSVTREAPENIGSALKSIVSRYGELKSDPTALVDAEGEELSLNKVDTALKSVGITLQDTNGQFRAFDDVIMELSERWDTLSKNQQRYLKAA